MSGIGMGNQAHGMAPAMATHTMGSTARWTAGGTATGTVAGTGTGTDPRLAPAAHQFEASLMKELLEPMERDPLFADGEESGDEGGVSAEEGGAGSLDTLKSLGTEALAQAIAERGGLGIAARILQQIGEDSRVPGQAGRAANGTARRSENSISRLRNSH